MGAGERATSRAKALFGIAWHRRGTVLSVVLVAGAIAMFLSFFRTMPYRTASGVRVDPLALDRALDSASVPENPPVALIDTEVRLVESPAVEAGVREELGSAPGISARRVTGTNVIELAAEAGTAGRAAQVADSYATAYVNVRNQQLAEQAGSRSAEIQARVNGLAAQMSELEARGDVAASAAAAAEQASLRQQLERLSARQGEGLAAAELVQSAVVPTSRESTRPVRTAVTALLAGLLVGTALALLLDRFDDSVRTGDDLRRTTGRDMIGTVPEVASWKVPTQVKLVTASDVRSPAARSYAVLAAALTGVMVDDGHTLVQFTSPSAREGKTVTVANLGVALARTGRRVLMVCCDLRTPRLHQFFGLDNDIGFTSVLLGKVPLSAAMQEVAAQPGLVILASGPLPPKPSELLSSGRSTEVIRSLRAHADIVLVDSSPILVNTDALAVAGAVDAIVLVCAAFRTDRADASRATDILGHLRAPIVGSVLNGATTEKAYAARLPVRSPSRQP